jgi:hypothetical protein
MITLIIKPSDGLEKKVNIRKTLSGDFLMREHPEIDIIIMNEKGKVLVLPKDEQSDSVYNLQERLFRYMVQRGVILPESVNAGNVYGSLEGKFSTQPPGGENASQVVIYNLANFIEEEMPKYNAEKNFEDKMEKALLKPDMENSTELGEVPQGVQKGSIPKYGFPTRGIYRYNY